MGVDKAAVRVGGIPMLERVVGVAVGVAERVVVLGRDGPVGAVGGVEFLRDVEVWAGPMPALIGLLERVGEGVVLLACDMPLVRVETVRALIEVHETGVRERGVMATIGVTREWGRTFAEPALAVYEVGVVPVLKRLIAEAKGSFQPLLGEAGVGQWEVPLEAVGELLNVNTVEAVGRAEEALREREGNVKR
jgi:molybdopterin-guanine dinucleotide biosynthesis protein A